MIDRVGVMDVVSVASQEDACIIFPTLDHAIALWPKYIEAFTDRHGAPNIVRTKTAIAMKRTKTVLRYWVPYEKRPEKHMDLEHRRAGFTMLTPYSWRDAR